MSQEQTRQAGVPLQRRTFVAACALAVGGFAVASARASTVIGTAQGIRGSVSRKQTAAAVDLAKGDDLLERDFIVTGADGFAELALKGDTRILLGNRTELLLDDSLSSQGGTMELGLGQMVFDRPEGLPKIDLSLRTTFGMIGVRGTKFFCGPNRGVFAVFVEHGEVAVAAGGQTASVKAGEGIEIAAVGAPPANLARWREARIVEAYASVGLAR